MSKKPGSGTHIDIIWHGYRYQYYTSTNPDITYKLLLYRDFDITPPCVLSTCICKWWMPFKWINNYNMKLFLLLLKTQNRVNGGNINFLITIVLSCDIPLETSTNQKIMTSRNCFHNIPAQNSGLSMLISSHRYLTLTGCHLLGQDRRTHM